MPVFCADQRSSICVGQTRIEIAIWATDEMIREGRRQDKGRLFRRHQSRIQAAGRDIEPGAHRNSERPRQNLLGRAIVRRPFRGGTVAVPRRPDACDTRMFDGAQSPRPATSTRRSNLRIKDSSKLHSIIDTALGVAIAEEKLLDEKFVTARNFAGVAAVATKAIRPVLILERQFPTRVARRGFWPIHAKDPAPCGRCTHGPRVRPGRLREAEDA